MKQVLAISGSARKNSANHHLLHHIAKLFPNQMELEIFDGIDLLPHFNPDLDGEHPPKAVVDFRRRIELADGMIICTPEYVFSLPGSLKNAIEWLVSTTLLSGKSVSLIVAAASGHKALESLDLIMTTLEANLNTQNNLLIQGIRGKINQEGQVADSETKEKIQRTIESFLTSLS